MLAAYVRTRQPKLVPEEVAQEEARLYLAGVRYAVDGE
jgi:hypothetical protein